MSEQTFTLPKGMNWAGRIAGIAKFLGNLSAGRNWEVTVRERRSSRSDQQNKYLNAVVYKILSEATGYERNDISAYCCGLMWGWKEKRVPKTPHNPAGVEDVPCRTTTTDEMGRKDVLKWDDFADYVAFLQRHFAQIKNPIYIPDPDPAWREHQDEQVAA
jgi:hypothetical protein